MNDRELRKVLRDNSEKINVPEKLEPKNVEVLLENIEDDGIISNDVIKASKKKISKGVKRLIAVASLAAIFVIFIVVVPAIKRQIAYTGYYVEIENGFRQLKSFEKLQLYLQVKAEEEKRNEDSDTNIKGGAILGGQSGETQQYSDTNVRTEGVNEPDIVKTDGQYIYACDDVYLTIIKPDGDKTQIIKKYELNKAFDINNPTGEMIVYENKLIIIGEYAGNTDVSILDISDVNDVKLKKSFSVEGDYETCRMYGEYLYVGVRYGIDDYDMVVLVPKINGEEMTCSKMYMTNDEDFSSYYVLASYRIGDETEAVDYLSIVNDGEVETYMTKENIYFLSTHGNMYDENGRKTEILKFAYEDGKIAPKATTNVAGRLADVFCIDEYNDYLRLVITSVKNHKSISTLYVFDRDLKITGKIDDIAPGEKVYSARYNGDIGYFVTYRKTDPLFSVDLSDPSKPEIIGELKIPGFSEYMHFWDDERLFGIGEDGPYLKISMFNVSDPQNVTEESVRRLTDTYGYSSALYNHRAILINGDKNIIGFEAEGKEYDGTSNEYFTGYRIFAYENGMFVEKISINYSDEDIIRNNLRGMYIGDYIYVVSESGNVKVLDMENYNIIAELR